MKAEFILMCLKVFVLAVQLMFWFSLRLNVNMLCWC